MATGHEASSGPTAPAGSATEAPLRVRRNQEIYAADGGWFRARWHFSFDQYYDPNSMGIGRLRVFNHDTLMPGVAWPMHPHRDIEGITYVVAGTFRHADSAGNGGILLPGAVQRVTLGSGLQHSEQNASESEPMQFIQMWILPDRHGLPPSIEQQQYTEADRHNRWLQLVRPEGSEGTGVTVHQDAGIFAAKPDAGVRVEHRLGAGHVGYLYLIEGAVACNGEHLTTGDAAYILGDGLLSVTAREPADLLLVETRR